MPIDKTKAASIGTTEAAFLLNISTARLRVLLKQGRVKGAYKVKPKKWREESSRKIYPLVE